MSGRVVAPDHPNSRPVERPALQFPKKALEKIACTRIKHLLSLVDNIVTDCLFDMVKEACELLVEHAVAHLGDGNQAAEQLSYISRAAQINTAIMNRRRVSKLIGMVCNVLWLHHSLESQLICLI